MDERSEEESFAACMRRWSRGDDDAADELLQRVLPWIRRFARARMGPMLRGKDESVDIVQDAVLEYLRYGQRFEVADEARFRALLGRIVCNVLGDRYAWYSRKRRDMHREQLRLGLTTIHIDPVGDATDPAAGAERREEIDMLRLGLELLEPLDREMIVRREFDKQSFESIAADLQLAADSVRKRFHRALPKLSEKVRQLQAGHIEVPDGE